MIDVLDDGPWERPELAPVGLDREYFAAARQGRLVVQRCPVCAHTQFPPKLLCVACGGAPEWLDAAGVGTVHTFTIVRRHGVEPFASMTPFVLAMIDLPEGVRLMGNVTGEEPEGMRVGRRVEAYALVADAELALPVWRVVEGQA